MGHPRFQGNELKYLEEVLESGFGSSASGGMIKRYEEALAKRFGVKYAITSTSGTTTLHQALAAFGVGPGDEVLVPVSTVISCPFAIMYAGATPVFVDVDSDSFLMDIKDLARKISERTKAIMAVHLCGLMCDMDAIMATAKEHNLFVLEDCAQCFLGSDDKGRLAGTVGHVGSFSTENSKHITTGDGGFLITNDEKLATRMRKFGCLGYKNVGAVTGQVLLGKDVFQNPNYYRHDSFGWNYRLPELAAAVGLAQLERADFFVSRRITMAEKFLKVLEENGALWLLQPQEEPIGYQNVYWTFAAKYEGQRELGISWQEFREKFMQFGGDGIYAGWPPLYQEPVLRLIHTTGKFFSDENSHQGANFKGFLCGVHCTNAEELQPKLMHFTTNQLTEKEMDIQAEALKRTIEFFVKK